MFELLSNTALFARFAHLTLMPIIFPYVEMVEGDDLSGPEKRQQVIDVAVNAVAALHRQGFVPAEMKDSIVKTAGDLIDLSVALHNATGFFAHRGSNSLEDPLSAHTPDEDDLGTEDRRRSNGPFTGPDRRSGASVFADSNPFSLPSSLPVNIPSITKEIPIRTPRGRSRKVRS